MKSLFKGFYNPSEEELLSMWDDPDTLFVFDTNVLLDLYQYEEGTRNNFLDLISKLKDRVWIPHQVALEYQRNRLKVIHQERDVFKKIEECFSNFKSSLTKKISEHNIGEKLPQLENGLECFIKELDIVYDKFKNDFIIPQRNLKPEVRQHDEIRDFIDDIFFERVGRHFEQAELEEIYSEGELRYSNFVPPGYEDAKIKKENEFKFNNLNYKEKFGDLILWKQLISKVNENNILKVVLVTRDSKKDWWFIIDKKPIGPLEDLQTEFFRETDATFFKMYLPADFMQDAMKYIHAEISPEAIIEVENQKNKSHDIASSPSISNNFFLDWLNQGRAEDFNEKLESKFYKMMISNLIKQENPEDLSSEVVQKDYAPPPTHIQTSDYNNGEDEDENLDSDGEDEGESNN